MSSLEDILALTSALIRYRSTDTRPEERDRCAAHIMRWCDAELRPHMAESMTGSVVASSLLVSGDEQLQGHVVLRAALCAQVAQMITEQHKREGYGVLVVDAAASFEHAVAEDGLEQGVRAFHDIVMGHEQ